MKSHFFTRLAQNLECRLSALTLMLVLFNLCLKCEVSTQNSALTYDDARQAILNAERQILTGGSMLMTPKENVVNKLLLNAKYNEVKKGLVSITNYPPAMHFFKAKEKIQQSAVFEFIQKMPKGALLHGHNTAMVSSRWVIKNITYRHNAMKCVNTQGTTILTFRRSPEHGCKTYVCIQDERSKSPDVETFDRELEKLINLFTPNPEIDYSSEDVVWAKFEKMFSTIGDAIRYLPVYRAYHYQLLEEAHKDGVIYLEIRTSFPSGYDDDNVSHPMLTVVKELQDVVNDFKSKNPNFFGMKIIFSTSRSVDSKSLLDKIMDFKAIHTQYPDFVIGFDLVGQEDKGQDLYQLLLELKHASKDVRFFFHAGETNWFGAIDLNILDAILLNTTRIGHGYALMKHPVLWQAVKRKQIALEVNPISNQVLHLLWDMRNHPAAFYISQNIPIVISNDDPGFWDSEGLSYDFYYAFMAFSPANAGLSILKQLAWNSIKFSSLESFEKRTAAALFQRMWDNFLDNIIASSGKV